MDVKYALSTPIALIVFLFAIVVDYYFITGIAPIINLLQNDGTTYTIAWGSVIALSVVFTLGAPVLTALGIADLSEQTNQ